MRRSGINDSTELLYARCMDDRTTASELRSFQSTFLITRSFPSYLRPKSLTSAMKKRGCSTQQALNANETFDDGCTVETRILPASPLLPIICPKDLHIPSTRQSSHPIAHLSHSQCPHCSIHAPSQTSPTKLPTTHQSPPTYSRIVYKTSLIQHTQNSSRVP